MSQEKLLELAAGLTAKTQQLCLGLESGVADLFDLVTPTTAELLRWWFGEDICAARRFNFHAGQRRAILNSIVAHEVWAASDLRSLYQKAAPDALLAGMRLAEVSAAKHTHPKYCGRRSWLICLLTVLAWLKVRGLWQRSG